MNRRKIGKALLLSTIGLISYSGFLIATMPAEKLWEYLPKERLPVKLSDITGTPWSGAAEGVTLTLGRNPLVLPSIRWQVEPAALPGGEIKVTLDLGNTAASVTGEGALTINQQNLTLENVELDTTTQWLMTATGSQLPGKLEGTIFLKLHEIILNDNGCSSVNGSAKLTNSQIAFPFGQFDLGNSTAALSCERQKLVARIVQKSSIMNSHGDFQLATNGRYTFTGKMMPDVSLPDSMKKGLTLLGKPDGSGAYPLRFRGSIN